MARRGMPRIPKPKKPKLHVERERSEEVESVALVLIDEHCRLLKSVNIEYVMQTQETEDGTIAPPRAGVPWATAHKASVIDRTLRHIDGRIIVNGNWWHDPRVTDHERRALVYHELCHFSVAEGRLRLEKHDFDGFLSELRHFGAWRKALEQVEEIVNPKQLALADDAPPQEAAQ